MPNIDVNLQPTPQIRPTEQGIEARVQSAYRGKALFNTAAEAIEQTGREIGSGIASAGAAAVQYIEHREISAGAKNDADMLAGLTDSWNQTAKTADPNDASVAKKWQQETLEPALEQFQKGFITQGGQKWAEARVDQLRNHFFEKTAADMSTLAGVAIQNNLHDVANKFSNTAIGDPSAVPFLLQSVDHSVDNMIASSPNLKGVAAEKARLEFSQKIKEEIVKSGMYGAIMNAGDPEAAVQAWIKKYPDYVSGPEAEVFAKQAKVQSRMLAATEKQNLLYTKELANQQVAVERNKIWSDNVNVDAGGKVNINPDFFKSVAALPGRYQNAPNAVETAKTLLDWGERQQRPEKVTSDPTIMRDLVDRTTDPNNPTTELQVLRAEADGKLSHSDGAPIREMVKSLQSDPIKNPIWKDTQQAVKDYFTGHGTQEDPMGSMQFAHFMQVFLPEYQREQREGKLQPNALDLRDPTSLIRRAMAPSNMSLTDEMKRLHTGVATGTPSAARQTITTKAAYDALPAGTTFLGADGKTYRKP